MVTTTPSVAILIADSNRKYNVEKSITKIDMVIIDGTKNFWLLKICPKQIHADLPNIPASMVSMAVQIIIVSHSSLPMVDGYGLCRGNSPRARVWLIAVSPKVPTKTT